jgi:hypothetical protein
VPQVRRILGVASVEIAARRRICARNRAGHTIHKGGACLVIKDSDGGTAKNYCPVCAQAILDQAAVDLEQLRNLLGLASN